MSHFSKRTSNFSTKKKYVHIYHVSLNIIQHNISFYEFTILRSGMWTFYNVILMSKFVLWYFPWKNAENLILASNPQLQIILNYNVELTINTKFFFLIRHGQENRSVTFICTSHPLNRSSVIIMLTNWKCKYTHLDELNDRYLSDWVKFNWTAKQNS
jgi:hypothetical protein